MARKETEDLDLKQTLDSEIEKRANGENYQTHQNHQGDRVVQGDQSDQDAPVDPDDQDEIESELEKEGQIEKTLTLSLPMGVRLDVGLTEALGRTRTFIQSLIEEGRVSVNLQQRKANYKVQAEDQVVVVVPEPREMRVEAEPIPLDIIYEDADILIVNKPQGMVVHPAPGAWSGTLVNALLYHIRDLSGINGVFRPGIVHRIDKDTSGLLVVAKNDEAHQGLAEQIKAHSMARRYQAVVHGILAEPSGTVDAPIGRHPKERKRMAVTFSHSKRAVTHYQVLHRFQGFTHIEARLETGRTHQIRVHMAYLGHPVLGDPLYSPKHNPFNLSQQVLHAGYLGLRHPKSGEWLEFEAPMPPAFEAVLASLHHGI